MSFAGATVAGIGLASGTTTTTPSVYSTVAPVTVLGRSLAADSNTDVAVAGVGSVPSNATAVQLSVTALSGTTTSSMYVYATGATKPTSANVRWQAGETVTIPVTVAVGTAGKIHLNTDAGTVTIKVAVVGYFSPANPPSGTAYADSANNIALSSAGTTVATVTVPAGSYDVRAKATIALKSGSSDTIDCDLAGPSGDFAIDESDMTLSTSIPQVPTALLGVDTTSGGTITLLCFSDGSNSGAYFVELVAVLLSATNGDVTTG